MSESATKLQEIAQRISAHLYRFEADKEGVNAAKEYRNARGQSSSLRPYFGAGAYAAGRYVGVRYISYQRVSLLTKTDALRYLAWLDEGNAGKHFEALRDPPTGASQ